MGGLTWTQFLECGELLCQQSFPLNMKGTVWKCYNSDRSSSTKLKLNEATKRNAWLSLRDSSPWRATNSEVCDVARGNRYQNNQKPWCIMIEQVDTTRPAVDSSEPSEAVME